MPSPTTAHEYYSNNAKLCVNLWVQRTGATCSRFMHVSMLANSGKFCEQ